MVRNGPSIRRMIAPIIEQIARILWRERFSLTEADRIWVHDQIDRLFTARLK